MSAQIDYPVFYNRALADSRVQQAKRNRKSRVISLLFSLAITAALWWFLREQIGGFTFWLVVGLIIPLVQLARSILGVVRANRDLRAVHDGLALGFGRNGLQVEESWLSWPEVGRIAAVPLGGRSDQLVVQPREGEARTLPL